MEPLQIQLLAQNLCVRGTDGMYVACLIGIDIMTVSSTLPLRSMATAPAPA